MEPGRQGIPLFTGIGALIGTLLIIQLWLVSASLDALLGGDRSVAAPAALASLVLFLTNGVLLLHGLGYSRHRTKG
jgi:hypothetical protein